MTVEELIQELQKIEDKSKKVYFDDDSWGNILVNNVVIDDSYHHEPVLLKN
jgi:hypothetical protein